MATNNEAEPSGDDQITRHNKTILRSQILRNAMMVAAGILPIEEADGCP